MMSMPDRAGAETDHDPIAVAITTIREPFITHAVLLLHGFARVAATYGIAFELPEAARHDTRSDERQAAISEMGRTHSLPGHRTGHWRSAQRQVEKFATEVVAAHRFACGRRRRRRRRRRRTLLPAPGQRQQRGCDPSPSKSLQGKPSFLKH
jgi:hypothetical protein